MIRCHILMVLEVRRGRKCIRARFLWLSADRYRTELNDNGENDKLVREQVLFLVFILVKTFNFFNDFPLFNPGGVVRESMKRDGEK